MLIPESYRAALSFKMNGILRAAVDTGIADFAVIRELNCIRDSYVIGDRKSVV